MIIIIGAGVVGASLAFQLARAGVPVKVIDAGRIAGGTSASSFAWVNSHDKTPRIYHDLNVAGMHAHRTLRSQFAAAPWWHEGGTIEWRAGDPARYRQKIADLQSWGYVAQWLDPHQLRELAPDLNQAAVGDAPVAFFPEEAWIDPVVYSHYLLTDAREHGAQVVTHQAVIEIRQQGHKVVGLRTADGTLHDADIVVNCTGRYADQAAIPPILRIPMTPTAGLLLFTPPLAHGLRQILYTPQVHIRPDGAGRLLICRNELEVAADAQFHARSPEVLALLAAAREVLPLLRDVEPEVLRVGVRAIPADQLPAIGPSPGIGGYYSAITHSGVTLAPYIAELIVDEIVHQRPRLELTPFRPQRFFV
ncbi:glycine/D-amino acid oxidase-like deaminating enzyme [Herbaspirillum sp. Sphag1AN]|uniref:NAD(P)/FAD-dependent oxidoreductase n=1 Tax=unclassified Herbaspirillum TaxID=2624150 RepID=UPI0016101A12|nr:MULTISPECIES: FAD-dependent oxidoreductase [unclassified Herbaspirillum]MBB3211866.1 glycine/D-amino acid oxidase-like deaminating enzyme [Herbaspirillum sp. Sphag1AN]MBB3244300.1 glycine/D-amino acid oxidase-like deaminating enzyme [Herbaspirillum sp. Sphag64]